LFYGALREYNSIGVNLNSTLEQTIRLKHCRFLEVTELKGLNRTK